MLFDNKTQKANIKEAKRLQKVTEQEKARQIAADAKLVIEEQEKKLEEFQAVFDANKLHAEKVQEIRAKREKLVIDSEGEDIFFDAVEGYAEKDLPRDVLNDIEAKRIDLGRKDLQAKQQAAIKRKMAVMKEMEEAIEGRKMLNYPKVVNFLKINGQHESSIKRLEAAEIKIFGEINPPREVIVSSRANSMDSVTQEKTEPSVLLIHDVTEEERIQMMRDKEEKKFIDDFKNELLGNAVQNSSLISKEARKSVFDIPSPKLEIRDQEMHDAARKIKEQYSMMKEDNLARSIIFAQKREEQKQKDKETHHREVVELRSKTAIQLKGKDLFSGCLEDSQLILAEGITEVKVKEYKDLLQKRFLKSIESSIKPVDGNRDVNDLYKAPLTKMINKAVDKLVLEVSENHNSISDKLAKKERSWFNIPGKLYDSFADMFHKAALMMGKVEPTAAEIFEEAAKYSNDMKQKIEKQQAIDNKRAGGKGPLASLISNSSGFRTGIVHSNKFMTSENKRRSSNERSTALLHK